MPEIRKDPIVDRWVIISEERAARPMARWAREEEKVEDEAFCPFCEGNEASTPPETLAFRDDGSAADGPGWRLRVVPNKFPALKWGGNVNRHEDDVYRKVSGVGIHEVIIETPDHAEKLADMPPERVAELFDAVRERALDFKRDDRLSCFQFFKNHGPEAGASLGHSHSQIIAMPVVSKYLKEELDGAARRYEDLGKCVYCEIIRRELELGARVVVENNDFLAIAPYAPRFAYETWLLPKRHETHFEDISTERGRPLAQALLEVLKRMNALLDNPPYNMMMHTAPFNFNGNHGFHWHIELMPVLTRVAGFEWGSGFHINPTTPEEAAKALREVAPV